MPGSQSASAFYQPNKQQQMQPMMQRQPSLESQYSSMHQQFVPSQSHQIEDVVAVSTLSIVKAKPESTFGRPLAINTAVVSAKIRERAMKKNAMVKDNTSQGGLPKEEHIDTLAGEGKTFKSEQHFSVNVIERQQPSWENNQEENTVPQGLSQEEDPSVDENSHLLNFSKQKAENVIEQHKTSWENSQVNSTIPQGITQEEDSLLDENSQLLNFPKGSTTQSQDSNVVGFFKKIQSFLFSPSPIRPKRSDDSESSCCESDFDSEFSEMTSGSFNVAEIEAIRDELDNLLLSDPPTPDPGGRDKSFFREPRDASQAMSLQDTRVADAENKHIIEMKQIKDVANDIKSARELDNKGNLKKEVEGTTNSNKLESEIRKLGEEGAGTRVEDIEDRKQGLANQENKCQLNGGNGGTSNSAKAVSDDKHGSIRDFDESETLIYKTKSVVKIPKETTV